MSGHHQNLVYVGSPISVGSVGSGDLTTDAWGVQKVSYPKSLFHGMFTFDIPPRKWFMYENGSEVTTSSNITSVGGAAYIVTSATKTDVILQSRISPRYQPNRGHLFSTALWCPNKTNDGVREWGIGTEINQVIFRLKADGKLYAVITSGGVDVYEQEIDTSVLTGFDVQKNNTYDIQFQWRSAGNYYFYIGNPATGSSTLVHTISFLGTLTRTSIENPALPAHFDCSRTTQDVSMYIGCVDITSENGSEEQLEYESAYAENVAVTTNTPVIVIKQPLLINSSVNTRDLTLARISVSCSKKAVFKLWSTRDASAITGAVYKSVNGGFVECDSTDMDATATRATAVTLSGLHLFTVIPVEASVPREVNNPLPQQIMFPIVRGDYIVITCTSATAVADVVVEWGEHI